MVFPPRTVHTWHLRTRQLVLGPRTLVMGIVNVTPDSFSDGGRFYAPGSPQLAVDRAGALLAEGADLLDLGAESTRPGAEPVGAGEEQARLLPVLEAIREAHPDAVLSVDTYHASTAREALRLGVEVVNDVSGLHWDPEMAAVMAAGGAGLVLMHTRGTPREWAAAPPLAPDDVLPLVRCGLAHSLHLAADAGITLERIVLDPGFGFGKRGAENYVLHAGLAELHALGRPLLVGTSRKGFLTPAGTSREGRLAASVASGVAAVLAGAHLLRVHDVAAMRAAADVADAVLLAGADSVEVHTRP